jgi:drug/metabolite transporter (DMT)-like permease
LQKKSDNSIAIVNTIGSSALIFSALLGWRWYREKMRIGQWMSILLILAGVLALKFV